MSRYRRCFHPLVLCPLLVLLASCDRGGEGRTNQPLVGEGTHCS